LGFFFFLFLVFFSTFSKRRARLLRSAGALVDDVLLTKRLTAVGGEKAQRPLASQNTDARSSLVGFSE